MRLAKVIHINGKPYYFHKIAYNYQSVINTKKQYPKVRYYWIKIHLTKQKKNAYAVYLDRVFASV